MIIATSVLVILALLAPSHEQDAPPSPCPAVFEYLKPTSDKGRWEGVLHITTNVPLKSIFLTIVLTTKADQLGNWIGEVSTQDNTEYRIESIETVIAPRKPFEFKFYVNFNTLLETPLLRIIKLNGREICNADNAQVPTGEPSVTPPVVTEPTPVQAPQSTSWYTNESPRPVIPEGALMTNPIKGSPNVPNMQSPVFNQGQKGAIPAKIDAVSIDFVGNLPVISVPPVTTQANNNECGTLVSGTTLIVNGTPASEGEWPWQIALYHAMQGVSKYICGGTLVSHLHIITAAHCVTRVGSRRTGNVNSYSVFLGKYDLVSSVRGVKFRYLSQIIIHDSYEPHTSLYDLAILEMVEPVSYSSWIQPACLWPENLIALDNVIGKTGTVVGWGFDGKSDTTSILHKVGMIVVSNDMCLQSHPNFFERYISEYTYCGGYGNGSSACNGDSGGGMMFQIGNAWYIRGVVSLGVALGIEKDRCDPSHHVVFTDVAKFLPWIKAIITGV